MKSPGLKGKHRKNDKYQSYKGEAGKIADNLLKRELYGQWCNGKLLRQA